MHRKTTISSKYLDALIDAYSILRKDQGSFIGKDFCKEHNVTSSFITSAKNIGVIVKANNGRGYRWTGRVPDQEMANDIVKDIQKYNVEHRGRISGIYAVEVRLGHIEKMLAKVLNELGVNPGTL